jgi:hypothetical protein
MLKIIADIFTGRPNPAWVLTDEQEARTVVRELAQNRTLNQSTGDSYTRLHRYGDITRLHRPPRVPMERRTPARLPQPLRN